MSSHVAATSTAGQCSGAGGLLRDWRRRRRLSQLELASRAEVSTRHLSFLETGRATPSREMVLHLAEQLDVPLRERNRLLLAAGYAPVFGETRLESPQLATLRQAIVTILAGHEPNPAVVVDRWWDMVDGNAGIAVLTGGLPAHLLEPPVNVLRVSLHPEGLAPRIVNLTQWRAHLLARLARQVETTGDPRLADLYAELIDYPAPPGSREAAPAAPADPGPADPDPVVPGPVVPLRLRHGTGELCFASTVTTFGTPLDVTLSELTIESFFPADAPTAEALRSTAPPRAGLR